MNKVLAVFLLILFIILILALIALPFFLNLRKIHTFTEIERALLTVIIALMAVFLGFVIARLKDRSNKKWKSAILSACDSFVRMSVQAKNVKESHVNSQKKMETYFPGNDPKMNNLQNILELKCNSCTDQMDHLKLQIDTSLSQLENMIDSLCDEPYCTQIHEAIAEKKQRLNLNYSLEE